MKDEGLLLHIFCLIWDVFCLLSISYTLSEDDLHHLEQSVPVSTDTPCRNISSLKGERCECTREEREKSSHNDNGLLFSVSQCVTLSDGGMVERRRTTMMGRISAVKVSVEEFPHNWNDTTMEITFHHRSSTQLVDIAMEKITFNQESGVSADLKRAYNRYFSA